MTQRRRAGPTAPRHSRPAASPTDPVLHSSSAAHLALAPPPLPNSTAAAESEQSRPARPPPAPGRKERNRRVAPHSAPLARILRSAAASPARTRRSPRPAGFAFLCLPSPSCSRTLLCMSLPVVGFAPCASRLHGINAVLDLSSISVCDGLCITCSSIILFGLTMEYDHI